MGHIVNAAFTDMENEKILNTAKLENKEDPFLVTNEQIKDYMNENNRS